MADGVSASTSILRVFISYSHDSLSHEALVLELSNRLRREGIHSEVDAYYEAPPEGWPRWMLNQLEVAQYVIVVCTENYERRFRGKEQSGRGKGAKWEGAIITQYLYDAEMNNIKFIPVLINTSDEPHIPFPLRSTTFYNLSTEIGYRKLYRRLTDQPEIDVPPVADNICQMKIKDDIQYSTTPPPSLHFITPPDPGFVGREEFLTEMSDCYDAGNVKVGALIGLGGTGKSSIARKWFDQMREHPAYVNKVFWWGFYLNPSLDECLRHLLDYISNKTISFGESTRSIDKINLLKTWLHRENCLVVFDGFEAIQMRSAAQGRQDSRGSAHSYLGELLKSFAESTSRVFLLVTSRFGIDELRAYEGTKYKTWEIIGLSLEDAINLFKKADIRAEKHEVETVWRLFDGHALSLRLLTTFLQEYYGGNIHAIQEIPALTSDAIEEYGSDEFDGGKARRMLLWYDLKLSEEERVFLKIFSLFAKPVNHGDLLSVFLTKNARLKNECLVRLTKIAFANLVKKLNRLHLLTTRKENGKPLYEAHPLIREYFSSLVGKDAPSWHQALIDYYTSIICESDYDLVIREKQIIHHAIRSRNYQAAIEASNQLLRFLRESLTQNGTIGLIHFYHVISPPLAGTSYGEVNKKAQKIYTELKGGASHEIHIRSAYFDNEEVSFDYFWKQLYKKSPKERMRRLRLLPCAIELIRNSMIEPFSMENPNMPGEIIHRFGGITKAQYLFFVQIMEYTETSKKHFMSTFGVSKPLVPIETAIREPISQQD